MKPQEQMKTTIPRSYAEPAYTYWRSQQSYDETLRQSYLAPLIAIQQKHNSIPIEIQEDTLYRLHWYFTVDMRERAPTVIVTESMSEAIHDLISQIMRFIDVDTIFTLDDSIVANEVKYALLSYKELSIHSEIVLDKYDHDQGLLRLSYFILGSIPTEKFVVDTINTLPAYQKYRACRFFRRSLFTQRIVWLPVIEAVQLSFELDDRLAKLRLGEDSSLRLNITTPIANPVLFACVRSSLPRSRRAKANLPLNLSGIKARLIRALSQFPPIKRMYENAWVFTDRNSNADDSAEHLYRWVREHTQNPRIYFILNRDSKEWTRLKCDRFNLIAPGITESLLLLNCDNIISSHAEYMHGNMSIDYYGDMMKWRYIFLQHGVTQNEVSHWLSNQPFDLFVTSSTAEHASIVADDTPYTYTEREAKRTYMPRFDRLKRWDAALSTDEKNLIVVMPTWRAGLTVRRSTNENDDNALQRFRESNYARNWSRLLNDQKLFSVASAHKKQIVFIPHPNSIPYIDAFSILPAAKVALPTEGQSYQYWFSRACAFITDYSSAAFDLAIIRRQSFYFQFDREDFYSGGHNWREGYFNYDRDGFGPVALEADVLVSHIEQFLNSGSTADPKYMQRMSAALPDQKSSACELVYNEILALRQPYRNGPVKSQVNGGETQR